MPFQKPMADSFHDFWSIFSQCKLEKGHKNIKDWPLSTDVRRLGIWRISLNAHFSSDTWAWLDFGDFHKKWQTCCLHYKFVWTPFHITVVGGRDDNDTSSTNTSWHSHGEETKTGVTGGGGCVCVGGWRSKAPKSEVRQSSFSRIVEWRSSSDFTERKSLRLVREARLSWTLCEADATRPCKGTRPKNFSHRGSQQR